MRILLCLSHAIEEYDQLQLFHSLGHEVCSIGGYIDPSHPHVDFRPALPDIPCVQEIKDAIDAIGSDDNLGAAQRWLPLVALEWADVIIYHHYLERLFEQWPHLAWFRAGGGRVVWRTVGQSVEHNERMAHPFRADGLEIVRYSPKERNIPGYAGEDALIRFWKEADLWRGWTGGGGYIANVTQDMERRAEWCNRDFWLAATDGLTAMPAGPGSEALPGGVGKLGDEEMIQYLQRADAYLYTGTQPASYTLGLLEALMVGVPVVSIGPSHMRIFPYGDKLFEGHQLAVLFEDDPAEAHRALVAMQEERGLAAQLSTQQRRRAVREFGREPVSAAWQKFLG